MNFEIAAAVLMLLFGVPAVLSDLKTQTISNPLTLGFSAASLLLVIFGWLLLEVPVAGSLVGGLIGFGSYLVLYFAGRRILGEADVKLSLGFGLLLGASSLQAVVAWLLASFIFAGVYALVMLVSKKLTAKQSFAYAPFMFAAGLLVLIAR